ncbi:DRG2 [Symbiodinium sp. CCMP2592]|nr:DRG2 [Symbiodinium sp. CCMP2592]
MFNVDIIVPLTQGPQDVSPLGSDLVQLSSFSRNEDATIDDFIDVLEETGTAPRQYCKCLYVYNKIDMLNISQVEELARQPYSVVISVSKGLNLDGLLERIWQELDLRRIYTKKKGLFPDFTEPIVLTCQRGNKTMSVENAVGLLHKSLLDEFKSALVWGSSVRASPQVCGLKHELQDEDVMQITKLTAAEKQKKMHGKKTGTTLAGGNTQVDPSGKKAQIPSGRAVAAMRLFVRGIAGETSAVEVASAASVADVQLQIQEVQGVPCSEQRLIFGGRSLQSEELLAACGVEEESTLFVNLDLEGGGKKRKKKTYTKPKKIKHKRKKVKLAVLKFYKVDSNDKVTRLRRECPHETCGPGVFMAMHFNRYYCGKCHLTYLIKKEDK